MVYEKGDRGDLANWRPLTLGPTVAKLYAGALADRLTKWASGNGVMSPMQKGFLRYEGCLEHNFVLQATIDECRRKGEEIWVEWLDLAYAFGSVPHSHILGSLKLMGEPEPLVAVIADLYDGGTTIVRSRG